MNGLERQERVFELRVKFEVARILVKQAEDALDVAQLKAEEARQNWRAASMMLTAEED